MLRNTRLLLSVGLLLFGFCSLFGFISCGPPSAETPTRIYVCLDGTQQSTPCPTPTPKTNSGSGEQGTTPTLAPSSSFPTDSSSAAKYLGITTDAASFRAIPDNAGPTTLLGWQISANHDITVSIGANICIDFVKDQYTYVKSGTSTNLSPSRIRSTSTVQIFVSSGRQLSFYKSAC